MSDAQRQHQTITFNLNLCMQSTCEFDSLFRFDERMTKASFTPYSSTLNPWSLLHQTEGIGRDCKIYLVFPVESVVPGSVGVCNNLSLSLLKLLTEGAC